MTSWTLKGGRFLSSIGYLNSQHAHAWDFVDAPLAYQAFLGGQYANDGLQVKWVAPIEQFVALEGYRLVEAVLRNVGGQLIEFGIR